MSLDDWKARIRAAFGPRVPDDDVVHEIAQHAAATYEAARAEGASPEEAASRVDAQIARCVADPAAFARRPRRPGAIVPPTGSPWTSLGLLQDARYAIRLAARQPLHTALVVATIALGISAAGVLTAVVYGVLLKPLPWPDASRLVQLYEVHQGESGRLSSVMTNGPYLAWADYDPRTIDAIGAWSGSRATITDGGDPVQIRLAGVTSSILPMFHAEPILGRLFAPGDEERGRDHVIILSEGLWRQHYGARSDIIGRVIRVDNEPATVVGILPSSFVWLDRSSQAWQPFHVLPLRDGKSGIRLQVFGAVARLRAGVTPQQASAEATARAGTIGDLGPVALAAFGTNAPAEVTATPILDAMTAGVHQALVVLLIAVGLLVATATANVAGLQLARGVGRRREIAIRGALGASRSRLVRQAVVENLLLGLAGGVVGLLLAAWMMRLVPALLPADFPRATDIGLDARVQVFTVLLALASGLVFGLLPAMDVARRDVAPVLVEDSLAPVGGSLRTRTGLVRAAIMAAQVAAACVLLSGAALLGRTFLHLANADIGYDRQHVLVAQIPLPLQRYPPAARRQFLDAVVQRFAPEPGVIAASYGSAGPFSGSVSASSFQMKRHDGSVTEIQSGTHEVGPRFFAAMGQRVLEGRDFTTADTAASRCVAIVNAEFARRFLDNRALGWTLPGSDEKTSCEIVGVVANAARQAVTDPSSPEAYFAAAQSPLSGGSYFSIVVRTGRDPRDLAQELRQAIHAASPDAPIARLATLDDLVTATVSRPRLYALLLTTFAVFALLVAGVGLFGVLSQSVSQRAREIGIRSALGASAQDVIALVARQSLQIVLAGIAIGLLASLWGARLLGSMLYGVTPHDAGSFAAVAALLLAAAALATLVPARRAARVDPVRVLRG